ncbi:unnamed protein product [Macrosiphum euphorbiae]|uniref:TTF-type domain-containing protein n=1 Tax=Macrosiphum euphorbiae TaxID=13131 RepID=A0AAV0XTL5_9HEMI|nr:unnamed protein product [Macrosiphum euphorbiae]
MCDSNKRKRKRVKVECMECGSQFNDDLKKKHEEKLHRGKRVNVQHVGAPKNPFESAAKRNLNNLSMTLKNCTSTSSTLSANNNNDEKEFEDKSASTVQIDVDTKSEKNESSSLTVSNDSNEKEFENKSDYTVQKDVDTKSEKNESSSPTVSNDRDEKEFENKSDSTVQKHVDTKSENSEQFIEYNIDENSEEISWLLCAGQMEDLVSNLIECNTLLSKLKEDILPNPIIFMLESRQVINRIKLKSESFLQKSKVVLDNLTDPSDQILSVGESNYFVEHDPGRRSDITSSSQRQYLLSLGPHQPKLSKYPINNDIDKFKQKSFSPIWYKEYPMLEYSLLTDSAYCFVCSLFPKGLGKQFSNEAWVKQGINSWPKMKSRGRAKLGKLEQHFSSLSHKAALHDYCNFMKESNHIDVIMNRSKRQDTIKLVHEKEFNKQIIIILFDLARTLCRQGLPFRGDGDESNGNFNQMVQLMSRHNPLMNRWLSEKSSRSYNVTYLGPRSQNEFIDMLSNEVRRIIVKEVQEASLFSVMADTTPDNSHKDRLAVCLRYTNNNGKAIERLLEIAEGVDKTGLGTAKQIIDILTKHSIGTDNLVFQSYDYASNMSGQFNGTQAKLSELVGHTVFYIPCQAHRMNTFLEHACNSSLIVSDMIDNLENLYVFFSASNKRYSELNKQMMDVDNTLQLRNLSKTRWTARAESIKAVWVSFEAICNTLQSMCSHIEIFDRNTRTKALGILKKMHSFDFIVFLIFMKNIMYKLKSLTETLEKKSLCAIDAAVLIEATIKILEDINSDSDGMNDLVDSAKSFAANLGIDSEYDFNLHHRRRKQPTCDFAKCKDIEAIQAELGILKEICKDLSSTPNTAFIGLIEKCEEVKHILPLANNICRSTMTDVRLDSLMLLSIEKDILDEVDINKIATQWSNMKERRIKF